MKNKFLNTIVASIICGNVTSLALAATTGGQFEPSTLALPAVTEIALIFGSLAGILLSPLLYWAFRNRNVFAAIPMSFLVAVGTIALSYYDPRVGFIGAFVLWIALLSTFKLLVNKHRF